MKNQIKLLLALCSGLLLAGCGGGGGSSVSPVAHDLVIAGNTVRFATPPALSSSKPKTSGGIVSQSSNVDGNNVTRDLFKASASGSPANADYELLYDATGNGSFATLYSTMVMPDSFPPSSPRRNYDADINGFTVDMNGDGSNDGRLWTGIDTNHAVISSTLNTDTDYYSKGWWLYAPSGSADYAMGAFIARPDSDVFNVMAANVSGMATYSASDNALYASKNSTEAGVIDVGIQLTANFDSNKINGYMNFRSSRFSFDVPTTLSESEIEALATIGVSYNGDIALHETDIMSDSSFSGSGSGMLEEMYQANVSSPKSSRGMRDASVNWGGKFFTGGSGDSLPGKANGTFAGEIGDNNNGIRFVGSFSAERPSP